MPAPVSLPHTWRPFGTRLAAIVLGLMLAAVAAVAWIAWGPEVRARFDVFQRATLVLVALMVGSGLHALARSRVTAVPDGLIVVNAYRLRRYAWPEVVAVSLRRGAPWATMDLADGTSISMFGIQGSDGQRAATAVRELREVIRRQSHTDRND